MSLVRQSSVVFLALGASVLWAQGPYNQATQAQGSYAIQAEAWQVVLLANQARASAGVAPLRWDSTLAAAARQHCLRMVAEGAIAHRYAGEPDVGQRAAQAGAHFSLIEENVAVAATPASVHSAWMRSRDHRANLLSPDVDRIGVAVVAGRQGLYAVADYERAVPVFTQAQVEAAIAGLLRPSGVALLSDSADARSLCVDDRNATAGAEPGFLMLWQGADLTRLPWQLVEKLHSRQYREAAVGSCPAQNLAGAFSAYRVAVLLY